MTYKIRDWEHVYENNRTRTLKHLEWVPVPNRMDGDGYTELLDHPNGAAHLGAWLALIQIASKCEPRGTLMREGERPHDSASLGRISRIAPEVFDEAIPRFVEIGWLEVLSFRDYKTMQEGAGIPHESAGSPHEAAPSRAREKGMEGNGIEGNGMEAVPSRAVVVMQPTVKPDHFEMFWGLFVAAGKELNEQDKADALRLWLNFEEDEHKQIISWVVTQMKTKWRNADYTPMPRSCLEKKGWTRVAAERIVPNPDDPTVKLMRYREEERARGLR